MRSLPRNMWISCAVFTVVSQNHKNIFEKVFLSNSEAKKTRKIVLFIFSQPKLPPGSYLQNCTSTASPLGGTLLCAPAHTSPSSRMCLSDSGYWRAKAERQSQVCNDHPPKFGPKTKMKFEMGKMRIRESLRRTSPAAGFHLELPSMALADTLLLLFPSLSSLFFV